MDFHEINRRAIEVIQTVRILEEISWPSHIEREFFEGLSKGVRKKLSFEYKNSDCSEKIQALQNLLPHLSKDNPLHVFTSNTIQSYINALEMIQNKGKERFQEISIQVYGGPRHLLFGSQYSHLKTAEGFLESFHDFDHPYLKEDPKLHTANDLKKFLFRESKSVLGEDTPEFVVSGDMVAKAAAAKGRVRIRKDAMFNMVEFKNLLVHEVFTHTLTAINGSLQTKLPLLAYGAPRTTKTQEGLATFSEAVTGLLDLNRLKRLSLRVLALDRALQGADFYELFDFFKERGQSDRESFLASSRILRGGYPQGGIVFTKDGVYLEGLIRVHSLFRWAFKTSNLDYLHLLFLGRMEVNDIFLLKEAFDNDLIDPPKYLPDWYQNTNLLAGKMAFSLILNSISLKSVEEHYANKILS